MYAMMASHDWTGILQKRIVCIMQNKPPFRSGSATKRPAESRMLLREVIEHCRPEFVVPQHRMQAIQKKGRGAALRKLCSDYKAHTLDALT